MDPLTSTAIRSFVSKSLVEPICWNPLLRLGRMRVSFLLDESTLALKPLKTVLQLILALVDALICSAKEPAREPQSLTESMTPLIMAAVRSSSSHSPERSEFAFELAFRRSWMSWVRPLPESPESPELPVSPESRGVPSSGGSISWMRLAYHSYIIPPFKS